MEELRFKIRLGLGIRGVASICGAQGKKYKNGVPI